MIRRLAAKGIRPRAKRSKQDFKEAQLRKRLAFARLHEGESAATWKSELQAVGDIKEFTYYPQAIRPRFLSLRSPWTYMTTAERAKPAFQRPKRWFPKQDWKTTRKQKVFGFVTSNGHKLAFLVPKPWTTAEWAQEVRARLAPFLRRAFPTRTSFQILLDGEKLLHGPAATEAMSGAGIRVLPHWPKYSPDLNPQENVWAWAEERLCESERPQDSFEVFQRRAVVACNEYPFATKLVGSMAKRVRLVLERGGASIGK